MAKDKTPPVEEKKDALATTPEEGSQVPAKIDFAADAGGGFEEADASSYAIPFLRQLQSLSPACKKNDPEYVKGAEEGDFINTVTGKLYKGDVGVVVIPCHYIHKYNEWAPNRGGFRGSHSTEEYAQLRKEMRKNDKGVDVEYNMDTNNVLQDAREHYCLLINDEEGTAEPVLLVLTSSQTKKSRKWMTQMQSIRIGNAISPMFSQMYKITSVPESNDRGSWAGVKIELLCPVGVLEVYNQAKQFRNLVRTGIAQAAPPVGSEDIPY